MYSKVFCCLNKLYYARKQILARQSFLLKSRVTALPLAVDLPNLQLHADDDDGDDDEFAQEMGHGTPCYAAHFPNLQHKTQQIFNNQSDYNLVDQILNVGRQKKFQSQISVVFSFLDIRETRQAFKVCCEKTNKRILDLLSSQSC